LVMSGIVIWGVGLTLLALALLTGAVILLSGAYMVFTGRMTPMWLRRFERSKGAPATPIDCVLLGTSQVLRAVALFLLIGPLVVPWVGSALELTGAPQLPALAPWPALVFAGAAYGLASLMLALVCMAVSFALGHRVKYVNVAGSDGVHGHMTETRFDPN
jgi:predicted Kef-type K+ transport protein